MIHEITSKLTLKGGCKRFWFENAKLIQAANFKAGMLIKVTYLEGSLIMEPDNFGKNKVSYRTDNNTPIIDINNRKVSKSLNASDSVVVKIFKNKIVVKVARKIEAAIERVSKISTKLNKGLALSVGSLFFGFGGLDLALAHGFEDAGVKTKLVFANEISSASAEHSLNVNPVWDDGGMLSNTPIEDLNTNDIPDIDILTLGYPCVGHSSMQTNKLKRGVFHPQAGLLFLHVIRIIQAKNPALVIFEQSPNFINKESSPSDMNAASVEYYILTRYLEEAGYKVETTVLNGSEHGHLEQRKRMCLVASSPEIGFDMDSIVPAGHTKPQLKDFMDDVALDGPHWKEMGYLDRKTEEKHNNFQLTLSDPEDFVIPVITATYNRIQPNTPIIKHPHNNLRRILTVSEHARIKGFDPEMFKELTASAGHSILGNSVQFNVWSSVGLAIGKAIGSMSKQVECDQDLWDAEQGDLFCAA